MKLSVVIPTYDRKESLRRTLDGLAKQDYAVNSFEVITVSDGSTDGTEEMLAQYAQTSPYCLRAINQPNGGPSSARNRGVREAQFDIIVFLDDDVEPVPELLSQHAAHHLKDDRVAVLGPMLPDLFRCHDEPAWIAWEHAMLQKTYDVFREGGALAGRDAAPIHFYSGNASIRRQWLLAVGGFDENFTRQEDVELAVRLERDCRVHFVFEFKAEGLHRPERSFESWLRIPNAYGEFDAQRIRDGLLNWSEVEANMNNRNKTTRVLSRMCAASPLFLPAFVALVRSYVVRLNRSGRRSATQAALSALYNVCYAHALLSTQCIGAGRD